MATHTKKSCETEPFLHRQGTESRAVKVDTWIVTSLKIILLTNALPSLLTVSRTDYVQLFQNCVTYQYPCTFNR